MVRSHTVMVWTHYWAKKSLLGAYGPDLGPGPGPELDNFNFHHQFYFRTESKMRTGTTTLPDQWQGEGLKLRKKY